MSILLEFIFIIILFLIGYARRMALLTIMTILFTVISNLYIFQCIDGRSMFCQNGVYMICVYDKLKILPLTPSFLPIKYLPLFSMLKPTYGSKIVICKKDRFVLTRVIGMPFDSIQFKEGLLCVNNNPLEYTQISNALYEYSHKTHARYKVANNVQYMAEQDVKAGGLAVSQDLRPEGSKIDVIYHSPYIFLSAA